MNPMGLQLNPCDPKRVSETLDQLWLREKQGFGGVARRASWSNYVLVVDEKRDLGELLTSLGYCQPSRFLVLRVLNNCSLNEALTCSVGLHRFLLSKSELLACEIVEISGCADVGSAACSLLLQLLLPGVPTQMLVDVVLPPAPLAQLMDLADSVVFDSARFKQLQAVEPFTLGRSPAQDLSWVYLSPLRDHIRQVFEVPVITNLRSDLQRIRLRYEFKDQLRGNRSALLIGWLMSLLKLNAVSVGESALSGASQLLGRDIEISFNCLGSRPAGQTDVTDGLPVAFEFDFVRPHESQKVAIRILPDRFESVLEVDGRFQILHPREQMNIEQLFRNLYLIGESFVNYRSAFSRAIEFQR